MRTRARLVVVLSMLLITAGAVAGLAKLVRQELRQMASGETVVVCIYDAGGREVERVYPRGNFCPMYIDE